MQSCLIRDTQRTCEQGSCWSKGRLGWVICLQTLKLADGGSLEGPEPKPPCWKLPFTAKCFQ